MNSRRSNAVRHFSLIRATDLLLIDANNPSTMDRPDAPDPTAWGLHGALHLLARRDGAIRGCGLRLVRASRKEGGQNE